MSIGFLTTIEAVIRKSPITVLPKVEMYTAENAFELLNGKAPESLKNIASRCKNMAMANIWKEGGLFPKILSRYGHLSEDSIIRSPYSIKWPMSIYNFDGSKFAYISEASWGDSVILPRDFSIEAYTDLACDCPLLIMRLADQHGKESIHLKHVRSNFIDIEVAHIVHKLKHEKELFPKEIIFSPRSDSRYRFVLYELQSFGKDVKVELIERNNNSEVLVTSGGWCILDDASRANSQYKSLVAARLWKNN